MNLIPKIGGTIISHRGKLTVHEPLTYSGPLAEEAYAMRFGLLPTKEGVLSLYEDSRIKAEGYRLVISAEGIELRFADKAGQFYGLITLQSLLREYEGGLLGLDSKIPYMEIEDAPRYAHRGFMLDVSRHFTGVTEIQRLLEQMALLKLNVFHWHLSDDQGFRIESKKFPKLNSIGSKLAPDQATDGSKRGYYTQEEIREVVAFAKERCITIIPEIDLPGHTTAIVAAYPELSCDGKAVGVSHGFADPRRILCAGKPEVYDFLYALLEEVCGLFPGPYFHLGGDEVPKEAWVQCEDCQKLIREKGLKDEEALQAYFTDQLISYLARLGKTAIGWNEILKSGTLNGAESAVVQFWSEELIKPTDEPYVMRELPKGFPFIFSSNPAMYFDYPYGLVTFKATYQYEPNVTKDYRIPPQQVKGLEAALWTETVTSVEELQRRIFPRLLALSEASWCADRQDYEDFLARVKAYEKTLKAYGIAFTPSDHLEFTPEEVADQVLRMISGFMPFAANESRSEKEIKDAEKTALSRIPPEVKGFLLQIGRFVLTNAMMYSYPKDVQEEILQLVKSHL